MATVKKGFSDRQRRRIRASIAKRLVECDIESLRKQTVPSSSPSQALECATAESQTYGGAECVSEHDDDDLDVQPSVEDTISPDIDGCHSEPVAMPSESSADSLTSPSDSYSDDSAESLSSFDHDGSLDESTSYSELSDEEREPEESRCLPTMLFPGAQLSNHDFSVALLSIFQKHSLTYSAVDDILKLFHCVLPAPSALPTSQHMLLKEFISYNSHTIVHRCCGSCCRLLSSGTLRCPRRECQASNVKEATFVEVMIDAQLKERFMGKTLS